MTDKELATYESVGAIIMLIGDFLQKVNIYRKRIYDKKLDSNLISRMNYNCRLDAIAAIKDHALNSGREQIYGLCVNGLMTHFMKSNGYHFELWELPVNMQTRMSDIQAKDYVEHIIETIKTISEKNGEG